MMKNRFRSAIITVALLWLAGCEAPRNNILDPNNPNSPYAVLEGRLQTFSIPRQNLAGVAVWWRNAQVQTISGSDGRFRFENILPEDGWLAIEKPGYHRDSLQVAWGGVKKVSLEYFLNAAPLLESLEVYSSVINQHGTPPDFQAALQARVSDPDGDIDTVFWEIADLQITGFLKFDVDKNLYTNSYKTALAPFNLDNEAIVGHGFDIIVKDKFGRRTRVGGKSVQRVIKQEITILAPLGGVSVPSMPTLQWQKFIPGFSHTYRLEVFKKIDDFSNPELFWQRDNIHQDSTRFTLEAELDTAEYFWVIWGIDEYLNRTRSKPASFKFP